jgi:hypothetical protein
MGDLSRTQILFSTAKVWIIFEMSKENKKKNKKPGKK